MTEIRAGSTYRAVLATPGALRFCVAGAIGRMPMAMFGLGSLLLVAALTGRYGLAGLVSAAGSVSYAVCAPQLAKVADRYGQGRVLRPAAVVFTIATGVFVTCTELRAPDWAVLATGALAGAAMPSLGSMVRARWSALLGSGPGLGTAYALESVVDELVFVVGPAVVTLLATEVRPAAGVVTAAAACALGTLALARQVGTEPAAHPVPAARPGARRSGRLPAPGLVTLVPVTVLLGAMFATIDLSTVAFAQQHGHKPLAGLILGTYALGSAVGGIWYGSRAWRAPLDRRFAVTLGLTVAGVATFWLMPGLAALAAVIFVAGLTISPTLIAAFSLVEEQARPGRRTEGMAWVSSAASVGIAVGSAVAGQAVDAGGARWGYGLAACWGGLALACCVAGLSRLRVPAAADGEKLAVSDAINAQPASDG
ncbi:MAG TPA: MFS transporter [Streptosporangiaceae bacterium]|nr:MFS transporter [Streptosporangiaceae bacterium]